MELEYKKGVLGREDVMIMMAMVKKGALISSFQEVVPFSGKVPLMIFIGPPHYERYVEFNSNYK